MAPGTEKESHPQPPLSDFHQAKAPTSSTRPEAEPPPTTPTQPLLSGSDPKGTVPCGDISMPRARDTPYPHNRPCSGGYPTAGAAATVPNYRRRQYTPYP